MLSMLYVRLTIKVKVGIPESFKVGWYPHKITGSSHLKTSTGHTSLYFNPLKSELITKSNYNLLREIRQEKIAVGGRGRDLT